MSLTKIEGDFKTQTFLAPSQKINETPIGVRITYIPTGQIVEVYNQGSYNKNFDKATTLIKEKKKIK